MEPNKLEKQFREQLNSREIKPSESAWRKLDAKLSETEKSKAKFTWMYVAVSFVGLLLIGTAYFNLQENPIENHKNGVVIQNPTVPKAKTIIVNSTNLKVQEKEFVGRVVQKTVNAISQISVNQELGVIENKVAEVGDSNQKTEQEEITSETNPVTVEELLAKVDKSARLNNKANPSLQVNVNPNQLLQQVDTELEPSYRQNVFSKVAENYKAVKDAFVNRNKE